MGIKEEKKIEATENQEKTDTVEKDPQQEKNFDVSETEQKTIASETISKETPGSSLRFSILAVLFSMIPIIAMLEHERLYSPLAPSQDLKVGQWRSSCGLFRFIPDPYKHCDSILLKMEEGGSLTLVNENTNTMFWEMRSYATCEEGCSAVVTEAGIVEIGGEPAALVSS